MLRASMPIIEKVDYAAVYICGEVIEHITLVHFLMIQCISNVACKT